MESNAATPQAASAFQGLGQIPSSSAVGDPPGVQEKALEVVPPTMVPPRYRLEWSDANAPRSGSGASTLSGEGPQLAQSSFTPQASLAETSLQVKDAFEQGIRDGSLQKDLPLVETKLQVKETLERGIRDGSLQKEPPVVKAHTQAPPAEERRADLTHHERIAPYTKAPPAEERRTDLTPQELIAPYTKALPAEERRAELTPHERFAPFICEFVGTAMLVFTVGCCIFTGSSQWNALAIASILMVSVYSFGPVSGGHLNPSVSLAIYLSKKMTLEKMCGYWVAQLFGGLAGAAGSTVFQGVQSPHLGPPQPFSFFDVFLVESLYTAMIAFVVLSCACTRRPSIEKNQFYALAIGFVVVAGGYAAGPVSGGAFNPAVTIGVEFASGAPYGSVIGAYVLFQIIGGILAALCFRVVRPDQVREDWEQHMTYSLHTKMASEFIGTWMLTFTTALCVMGGCPAWAISAAACCMCMIYSLNDVSKGFFNPAVTLAVVLSSQKHRDHRKRYCSPDEGLAFMGIQVAAGILASLVAAGVFQERDFPTIQPEFITNGWMQNLAGEVYFTFLIAFVALAVTAYSEVERVSYTSFGSAASFRTVFQVGLSVGLCTAVGGIAMDTFNKSGGSLNPAVTMGMASASLLKQGFSSWLPCIKFMFLEMLGGAMAASVFSFTHAKEYQMLTLSQLMPGREAY